MPARFMIYGLTDPRSGEIRYVGKSSSGMKRARSHAWESATRHDRGTHKGGWIRLLQRAGLTYGIEVLETCDSDALDEAEREWIARGRALGWPLTNLSEGGEGQTGYRHTPEARARIGDAQRGKILAPADIAAKVARIRAPAVVAKIAEAMKRPEVREKIRIANLGKKRTAEMRLRISAAARAGWIKRRARGLS